MIVTPCLLGVFQSRERGVTHYPRPVMVTTISMWPGHTSFCCFRFPISGSDLNTDSAGSGHSRLRPAQIITVITRPGQHQPLMNEISTSRWISFPCPAQKHQSSSYRYIHTYIHLKVHTTYEIVWIDLSRESLKWQFERELELKFERDWGRVWDGVCLREGWRGISRKRELQR